MIIIVDFGSQTTHLISRRLRQLGIQTTIVLPENAVGEAKKIQPQGIILSGGPSSVYDDGVPTIDKEIFSLGIPTLDICYGLQLRAHLLGGEVVSGSKEYGPAKMRINSHKSKITQGLPEEFTVWMSHGDSVLAIPQGFSVIGSTDHVPYAFIADEENKAYGVQFHPEVEHTEQGMQILKNFLEVCNIETKEHVIDIKEIEEGIKKQVGDAYVVGAVSGGVDSTVAGVLTAQAVGEQFVPVFVNNGLMREGTEEHVKNIFTKYSHVKPIVINREGEMVQKLKGIDDPEEKRKIIGNDYIEIFEEEMEKLLVSGKPVKFLLQGTIYSDVIESQGTKHASKIKSHHNVGGLPEKMKLELLEPLRQFYKDEVREIGHQLGLPDEFIYKQPFPGPGYAVRIRGEVTKERLESEKQADNIVLEELEKANLLKSVFLSFPVMTGAYSTAVKGDGRQFGEVVCLRVVESKDIMTSTWARLPYEILQKISSRIVNEVPNVSRVVYDITTKPPATMEWE